jgi:hypothetical protein
MHHPAPIKLRGGNAPRLYLAAALRTDDTRQTWLLFVPWGWRVEQLDRTQFSRPTVVHGRSRRSEPRRLGMATNTSGVEGGYGGASGKKLMASGRFDGGPKEKYMRDTAVALQAMGEEVLIVTAGGGAKFGKQTMSCLYNMQIMVAFVTEDYGEKTDSAYCTFNEIEYCADHQKPVIPIKLYAGAWPPRPGGEGDAQNAFFFTPTLVYIDGVGKSAEELARAIVAAATDSHDAVTKREAAVAIQAAQRGKQARQAMRAGVVVENPLAAGGGGKGPAAQAQPQGASKGKVAAAIVMLLVAAIFIYLMEAPMAEAEAEAEAEAGVLRLACTVLTSPAIAIALATVQNNCARARKHKHVAPRTMVAGGCNRATARHQHQLQWHGGTAHRTRPAQRCAPALAWGARKAIGECTASRACGWRSKPPGRAWTRSATILAAANGTGVPPSFHTMACASTWKARGAPAAQRRSMRTGGCAGASEAAGGGRAQGQQPSRTLMCGGAGGQGGHTA